MKYKSAFLLPILLTSCAIEPRASKTMALSDVMRDIKDGMHTLNTYKPPGYKPLGLVPAEITATLVLTTNAQGNLAVNLAASPTAIGSISTASAQAGTSQSVQRTNTITVKLTNVYLDKDGNYRPVPGLGSSVPEPPALRSVRLIDAAPEDRPPIPLAPNH